MAQAWRLLLDGPIDGELNMAVDRAVQCAHAAGAAPPTLRLYSWARPTVTLGRFQDVSMLDAAYCREQGIDVVRRFTGGRGVLHDHELTYGLIAGVAQGVPRGVAKSYVHLCQALVRSFEVLGVPASITSTDSPSHASGACYLQTTRADVAVNGGKLSGSAQVWLHDTVLQHGSFVLSRDIDRESRVFLLGADETRELASAETLTGALGRTPALDEVVSAVCAGFESALGINLSVGTLNMEELRLVGELLPATVVRQPSEQA